MLGWAACCWAGLVGRGAGWGGGGGAGVAGNLGLRLGVGAGLGVGVRLEIDDLGVQRQQRQAISIYFIFEGLGFGVWSLGLRVWGLGFRAQAATHRQTRDLLYQERCSKGLARFCSEGLIKGSGSGCRARPWELRVS